MNNLCIKRLKATVALFALLGLAACGGGRDSGGNINVDPTATVDANVGRCAMTYSNAPDAHALLLDAEGVLVEVVGGSLVRSLLADTCFTEGEVVAVDVRPSSELTQPSSPGDLAVSISNAEYFAGTGSAGSFLVGTQVTIGAGTAQAEARTITALDPFTLDRPLDYPHETDEVVVVTEVVPSPTS